MSSSVLKRSNDFDGIELRQGQWQTIKHVQSMRAIASVNTVLLIRMAGAPVPGAIGAAENRVIFVW